MSKTPQPRLAPSLDEIEAMALDAIEALPEAFRGLARAVVLQVADFAPEALLDGIGIEAPFELTGLYEGIPLTEKSVMQSGARPDMVWLFRRPILDEWVGRGDVDLTHLVAHVTVHELAHHFGWSDDEIAAIDRWWE